MIGISPEQLRDLEDAVRIDPGAAGFAALAEAYRRAGRLQDAEDVVRQGLEQKPDASDGRLVLALTLLDQGHAPEARDALEVLTGELLAARGIQPSPTAAADEDLVSDTEIDDAFSHAETDTDQLIDPNRVAEAAVAHVDAAASQGLDEDLAIEPGSDFATATMAGLLEAQGDESGAERIRAALEVAPQVEDAETAQDPEREQLIGTLERWLDNLRGDRS